MTTAEERTEDKFECRCSIENKANGDYNIFNVVVSEIVCSIMNKAKINYI